MYERFPLFGLAQNATARHACSALPDAPVVPEPPPRPRRTRRLAARVLAQVGTGATRAAARLGAA
jgi:hypothetical protein